ncbi:SDR family NAD(P)-dependent oxidoreductase [Melittangium boletus]|uniref:3-oxoacyl-ACP reductase n=1 Tax=Melittangium boletus DSM 14713 TaxID=1294270 RepID=A0A250IJA8_9BACT|nr:glucose 1-dehydrogenase [Melittangium boletus]ATB31261.1 3-oxoacyl-ACP reductase [Melittangium boletus DSM 14713]
MGKLEQKVAIITGASRGIGAAVARRLASDGAKVVVNYVRNADAAAAVVASIQAAGGDALAVCADVADESQMQALFTTTLERHGRLDILVNNAAAFGSAPLDQIDRGLFQQLVDVNIWGVLVGCRLAGRHMTTGGRVINFSSIGVHKGFAGGGMYAATKAAVESLTRTAATELAPRDISVNALIVGQVATDMGAEVPMKMRQQIAAQTLIGKIGRPEDVGGVVSFLASDDARWVTGQTLGVNGGYLMR